MNNEDYCSTDAASVAPAVEAPVFEKELESDVTNSFSYENDENNGTQTKKRKTKPSGKNNGGGKKINRTRKGGKRKIHRGKTNRRRYTKTLLKKIMSRKHKK